MKHLTYASYIVRHKYFVFAAGLRTGAPIWRLVIHDWSKMLPSEWFPYVESFCGPQPPSEATNEAFINAWRLHHQRNPHHWQHWLVHEDDGPVQVLRMPDDLVREMVADWMGAGRAIHGRWDVVGWYAVNRGNIQLHPDVRAQVERLIDEVFLG